MSQQDWKFLAPLASGTPSDSPITVGDTLLQALYKLQGQIDPAKLDIEVLNRNAHGVLLVDMLNADKTLTEEESQYEAYVVINGGDGTKTLTFFDGAKNPSLVTLYCYTANSVNINVAGGNFTGTMEPAIAFQLIYAYQSGGNSAATFINYVPFTTTITPGTALKVDFNKYGLITGTQTATKSDVGLGNVDNTSDINKPISTATQTALNAKVDDTTTVNGYALSSNVTLTKSDIGLGNVDNTSDLNKPISTATQNALDDKEDTINKGAANGYAPLDSNSKVPVANLPDSFVGALKFKGTWNANTDVITSSDVTINGQPIPTASTSNEGWYFIVTVAGSTNKSGITDWKVGDWIISDGSAWQKIDNTDSVVSVNGLTGVVTLTTNNVADSTDKRYVTDAEKTKLSNLSGVNTGDQTITLTSDVAGSGTGSFATTIQPNVVSNSKLAQVATQTFKGRNTAGTGNVEDLTVAQATSMLNVVVGDSGSGGTKGLVPAPITGDANKVLVGAGTFSDLGAVINNATAKTTPVDNDMFSIMDSAASNILKKLSWANIKATMKTYMDTLYLALPGTNGIAVRTSATTAVSRSIAATTGLTTISNGDGVAGNPTVGVSLSTAISSTTTSFTNNTNTPTPNANNRLSGLTAGTYLVTSTASVSSNTNNSNVVMGVYAGTSGATTLSSGSDITCVPRSSNNSILTLAISTTAIVTISTGDVIEPKWNISAGTVTVTRSSTKAVRIA